MDAAQPPTEAPHRVAHLTSSHTVVGGHRSPGVFVDLPSPPRLRHAPAYLVDLTRRLRADRPDLVSAESVAAGFYGAVAGRLARVPVLWDVERDLDGYRRPVATLARGAMLLLPDAIVTHTHTIDGALGSAVRRAVPHAVIGDSYRAETPVAPRHGPHVPQAPVVALVGRFAPAKGQHLFLDALEHFSFLGGQARGLLLGQGLHGDQQYAASVADRISGSGLFEVVDLSTFDGSVSAALADVDVLVSASTAPGTDGRVVLEAMANGVPVVVPDTGDPAELVEDGVSGLTYPAGDATALAGVLGMLLEEPALYTRLSAGAIRRAADFDPDVVAAQREEFERSVSRLTLVARIRRLLGR